MQPASGSTQSVAQPPSATTAAAPPSSQGPPVLAPGPPVPSAQRPTGRKLLVPIIAIVVVVIVVVAVLALSGVLSSKSGGTTSATLLGSPASYRAAVPMATTEGQSQSGGPWIVVAAEGLGLPNGVSQPNLGGVVGTGCPFETVAGSPSQVILPGTATNATPGEVATWIFFAKNPALTAILMIEVANGTATPLGEVTGSGCISTFTSLGKVNATNAVDSTVVAASTDSSGGTQFLTNNTGAVQTFILLGESASTGGFAFWYVSYSTFGFLATGGNGMDVTGTYYANSGDSLAPVSSGNITC